MERGLSRLCLQRVYRMFLFCRAFDVIDAKLGELESRIHDAKFGILYLTLFD
jgi:hypothetical protein